jgi:hypothetical protein
MAPLNLRLSISRLQVRMFRCPSLPQNTTRTSSAPLNQHSTVPDTQVRGEDSCLTAQLSTLQATTGPLVTGSNPTWGLHIPYADFLGWCAGDRRSAAGERVRVPHISFPLLLESGAQRFATAAGPRSRCTADGLLRVPPAGAVSPPGLGSPLCGTTMLHMDPMGFMGLWGFSEVEVDITRTLT